LKKSTAKIMQKISVQSEIGRIEAIILHSPGIEVEKMTPENAQRDLYSDILNLSVASQEYQQFKNVLSHYATTYEISDLLQTTLEKEEVRQKFIQKIARLEANPSLIFDLENTDAFTLAKLMIEGIELKRDNLTRFLSHERYSLNPLHNIFFTRDASMVIGNRVLIGQMASNVRAREALIMDTIFRHHPIFNVEVLNPSDYQKKTNLTTGSIEGGDVLVVRDDILLIGTGSRTSTQAIDFLINVFKNDKKQMQHILVQELPRTPESFIHLDMVFTMLDVDTCMAYKPLIEGHTTFRTIHIQIENGQVTKISHVDGLLTELNRLNMSLKALSCGGTDDWHQEREQWHSGANFLALAPGVVMGYERNVHTVNELVKNGYDVIRATDVTEKQLPFPNRKTVITLAGSELARGGGGARCMSMPLFRKNSEWK
jgi:arginine deiminase